MAGARQVEHASMPGFNADPGSAVVVAGSYVVRAVQTQVVPQGVAGRGIIMAGSRSSVEGVASTQAPQAGCKVASCKGGWQVTVNIMVGKAEGGRPGKGGVWRITAGCATMGQQYGSIRAWARQGVGGAVVGWYLAVPVVPVVDGERWSKGGVKVVVMMKRVAVGKALGGFEQAVGIRSMEEWFRHKMNREQLVGVTGQKVQASGGREVLRSERSGWGRQWRTQSGEVRRRDRGGQLMG